MKVNCKPLALLLADIHTCARSFASTYTLGTGSTEIAHVRWSQILHGPLGNEKICGGDFLATRIHDPLCTLY